MPSCFNHLEPVGKAKAYGASRPLRMEMIGCMLPNKPLQLMLASAQLNGNVRC
jgi:hypothetical protein